MQYHNLKFVRGSAITRARKRFAMHGLARCHGLRSSIFDLPESSPNFFTLVLAKHQLKKITVFRGSVIQGAGAEKLQRAFISFTRADALMARYPAACICANIYSFIYPFFLTPQHSRSSHMGHLGRKELVIVLTPSPSAHGRSGSWAKIWNNKSLI